MVITKEQLKAANVQAAATLARRPVARAARYDVGRGLVVVELEGGCEFAFPVTLAERLAGAPRAKLSKITLSPNGRALHWPLLDAALYVPGLIEGAFGSRRWMQRIGKLGGAAAQCRQSEGLSREWQAGRSAEGPGGGLRTTAAA